MSERDDLDHDWDLRITEQPALDAAAWMAVRIRAAVDERGEASVAVSGGGTAPPLFEALVSHGVPWDRVEVWQVDERVLPDGHPERNAGQLAVLPARAHPMPVTDPDLVSAAAEYAAGLPERFDVVHLGLGDDGHTASWPPGDDVPIVSRRAVEVIGYEFNGFRRMTLTAGVVNGARARMMLTHGPGKAPMMARWAADDHSVPIAHVRRSGTTVFVDRAASPWST